MLLVTGIQQVDENANQLLCRRKTVRCGGFIDVLVLIIYGVASANLVAPQHLLGR